MKIFLVKMILLNDVSVVLATIFKLKPFSKNDKYKLAQYLDEIIKPGFSNNEFMIKDTFDFVNIMSETKINQDEYIVSFDVSSLFTNVPVNETIEIILNKLFKRKFDTFHGLSHRNLRELLEICTQKSIFCFDGQYYEQIDGVSMGCRLVIFLKNNGSK